MFDAGQILIVAAISIMTAILTIIGIQLIFILRDFRRMMTRGQSIIDGVEKFGMNMKSGSSELMGFVAGLKNVLTVIDHISESHKKKNGTSKK